MAKEQQKQGVARKPTIVDVAQAAGVAIGTVSRYLNGLPIRRSNREPIEQAIAALGFRRNTAAVAMKTNTTHIVGFMAPHLSEFHSALLDQLTRRMRAAGRAVLSHCHDQEPRSIADGLEFFASHRVDAVVMDGGGDRPREIIESYVNNGLVVVLYDNDLPGISADRVFVENRKATRRAVDHLVDLGHERIATIHGPLIDSVGRERFDGYRDSLVSHGIKVRDEYCMAGNWFESGGHAGMRDLMALAEPPTALFSANYDMTIGALRWLREHDMDAPDDISLVSFDDIPAFSVHRAGITAIRQPIEEIADTITATLDERLAAGPFSGRKTLRIDGNIMLRGSARSIRLRSGAAKRRHPARISG